MPSAEIIAIGTELLLGEIQDTNTHYLARVLRDAGINLYRTTTVGDNASRIAQVVRESLSRTEIVITTGGLGPTVDDPTRQAVAQAVGVGLEFRPDLWEQITERFQRYGRQATENNRRQAFIPAGAIPVANPVGTAPAFIVETDNKSLVSLPGVPREMEYLVQNSVIPYLRQRFQLRGTIKALVLHAAGTGESQIDEIIGDLEMLGNPTVGLSAHAGQIDIRVTARADSIEEADHLIEAVSKDICTRLGDTIYGAGDDSLESIIQARLAAREWKLAVVESGLDNLLIQRLASCPNFLGGELIGEPLEPPVLIQRLQDFYKTNAANLGLGSLLREGKSKQDLSMWMVTPDRTIEETRSYGGPPQMASLWATNTALDWLRRYLEKS